MLNFNYHVLKICYLYHPKHSLLVLTLIYCKRYSEGFFLFDSEGDVEKSVPLTQRDTDSASSQRQLRPAAVPQVPSDLADEGYNHSGDHRSLRRHH